MPLTACDRLISVKNLKRVWDSYYPKVRKSSPGIDGITPKQFNDDIIKYIRQIRKELRESKTYSYSSLRGVDVPKKDPTKFRIICVPTIQDRVIQRALLEVIEQKATKLGIANDVSFGFVKDTASKKRGATAARVAAIGHRNSRPWVFKTDITAFFDRIKREELIDAFRREFQFSSLMPLIEGAIRCEVNDSNPRLRRILDTNGIKKGRGLRQGMPLSPILSNFVLKNFDHAFAAAKFDLVRYADDLIVLASSRAECEQIKILTVAELAKLGLELSKTKTEICEPNQPVEFLGMELGLHPTTGKYVLTISNSQIAKIKERFTNFHDIDYAIKENLDLLKLLRRLENMKSGYRAAYGVADNFGEFTQRLDQWPGNCLEKIYSSIFSQQKVSVLTVKQRQFLHLT